MKRFEDFGVTRMGVLRRSSAIWVLISYCCASSMGCQKHAGRTGIAADASEQNAVLLVTPYGSFDPLVDAAPEFTQRQLTAAAVVETGIATDTRVAKIVQCVGRIEPAWRVKINDLGVKITGYVPNNALTVLVRPDSNEARNLEDLAFVRAVVDTPRMLKIDPRLVSTAAQARMLASANDLLMVNVELRHPSARETLEPFIVAAGGSIQSNQRGAQWAAPSVLRVQLGAQLLAQLASRSEVVAIEPSYARLLLNDRSYGLMQSGMPFQSPMWTHGLHGEKQIVAFADTGLEMKSCFFRGDGKVVAYEDIAGNDDGDPDGHGTHVAGTIAGDNFGNNAYDMHDGIAPAAGLYVQDVAEGDELVGLEEDLGPMLDAAYQSGARIHSNSWADEDATYGVLARSVDAYVATHRDFLVIAANGNAGAHGPQTVGSPATAKNVISVGAHNGLAIEDVAYFSSQGPTADGRIKPTLVAPGMGIVSASHRTACGTQALSGTSMAAPGLAGAAALVRQYFVDGFYPTGVATPSQGFSPTAALIKAVMMVGADDMRGQGTLGRLPANGQGFGRLQLSDSLLFAGDVRRLWVQEESDGLETDQQVAYLVTVKGSGSLHVVLTWLDVPASPGSAKALVNDLDLEVVGPKGTWLGNAPGTSGSSAKAQADRLNVEEVVHIARAKAGQYVVVVRASHVPLGPQPFVLAVVGRLDGEVEITTAP